MTFARYTVIALTLLTDKKKYNKARLDAWAVV